MGPVPVTQSNPMPPMPSMNNPNNGPRIKTEPGMENQNHNMPAAPYQNPVMPLPNATTAQQRAAQNLQAAYGQRAAASIDSIRGGAAPPQPQQNMPQNMQHQQAMHHQQAQQQMQHQQMQQQRPANAMPPQQQQQARPSQPEIAYSQAMAAQAAQMQQTAMHSRNGQPPQNAPNGQYTQNGHGGQNPQGGVGGAQTDGAGDDSEESIGVIKQFDSEGNEIAMGRIDIDNLIRGKIESMGKAMEGGGLMLPLKEATKTKNRSRKNASSSVPQTDGPGSDDEDEKLKDELDEDAINSDLDDPDDGLNDDDDDDDGMSHMMLCMYDKVQRVKNKWYVTLLFNLKLISPRYSRETYT
jgi:transcription initiation factor TFIIA large subunit